LLANEIKILKKIHNKLINLPVSPARSNLPTLKIYGMIELENAHEDDKIEEQKD